MFDFLLAHPVALAALVLGYVLLVFEFCIPGFGVPGIMGSILAVLGIITMQPTPLQALILVLISVVLLSIAFSIALHSLSKGRLSRSKLVLNEAINQKKEASEGEDMSYFIGRCGKTHTALRPAGIAEFDGVKLNVVSDGDFIAGRRFVRVERVEGNRIVVRETDENGNLL